MNRQLFLLGAIAPLFALQPAHGFGTRVDDIGALATARGNAFTATADNPSALYYNPAGITQIDYPTFLVGAYGLMFDVDYQNPQGDRFSNENEAQLAPYAYFTLPIQEKLTLGLTAHVPFGLENNWSEDTTFSTLATKSSFRYLRFSPVLAWKALPTFSLAAGLTINDGTADLRRHHPLAGEIRLKGSDVASGYILGALWQPTPRHSFGLTYRSRTTFDLGGEMTVGGINTSISAKYPFPEVAVIGYSFRPSEAWNLEFNLDWTNWDILDTVTVVADDGSRQEMPFHWKSSFIYKLGATRYFKNSYHLSAGYMLSENSVPNQYFTPSVPDADRHLLSAGIGRTHENIVWDIAYQFGISPTRHVRNSQSSPGSPETADGDYKSIVHAISTSISYHF